MAKAAYEDIITGLDIRFHPRARGRSGQGCPPTRTVPASRSSRRRGAVFGASRRASLPRLRNAISSVSACLEKVERMAGIPVERALVAVSGTHIMKPGVPRASWPSPASDGEIREEDVHRAIEAARTVATPLNYGHPPRPAQELHHRRPDRRQGSRRMTGIRLEVDAQIIQSLSNPLKNLTRLRLPHRHRHRQRRLGNPGRGRGRDHAAPARAGGGGREHRRLDQPASSSTRTATSCAPRSCRSAPTTSPRTSPSGSAPPSRWPSASKIEQGPRDAEGRQEEDIHLSELGAETDEVVSRKFARRFIEARVEEILERNRIVS